jgi:hypothetical protein
VEEIKEKSECIAELQKKEGLPDLDDVRKLQTEVHSLMAQEELQWLQRSKELCLKNGDRNTKFFMKSQNKREREMRLKKL